MPVIKEVLKEELDRLKRMEKAYKSKINHIEQKKKFEDNFKEIKKEIELIVLILDFIERL